jgi:two-component system chemotaxis sensor kinase CheA
MDELLKDFLVETAESLDSVDTKLVQFERDPQDIATLNSIFRLVHTIKGTCGFLGLPRLETLTHAAEAMIGQLRDGRAVSAESVGIVLAVVDRIKAILAGLEAVGREPDGDDSDLVDRLVLIAAEVRTRQDLSEPMSSPEDVPQQLPEAIHSAETADGDLRPAATGSAGNLSANSIRVGVETLERLLNLVSELVLTRNQLLELARNRQDHNFSTPLQRLSIVTAELQESVMQTRMQPIGHAWQKLPRLVRDLSMELRKDIRLVTRGEQTELDRQVLDHIKDPLIHLVRNAGDHGIEHPEDRIMAGKRPTGTIALSAYHAAGAITIEITDDGRGLDFDRIRAKAIKYSLVPELDAEKLSDAQLAKLIFHPGFSTSERVTAISGRGVGLDVVQNNIEAIGGAIDVRSGSGRGTTFTLRLPLTLAIVSVLMVGAGGQRFALPQTSVLELLRLGQGSEARVERIDGSSMLMLRGQLLPLVSLAGVLGLPQQPEGGNLVAVLAAGSRRFAINVDSILHTEEIVVKPMATQLRQLTMFSGNTILGDGSVVLIVEPSGLARAFGIGEDSEQVHRAIGDTRATTADTVETYKLLLFRCGSSLMAVPISAVSRLEDIADQKLERVGERSVVQFRGRLMPMVDISSGSGPMPQLRPCLVISWQDISVGLIVDEILDVVEDRLDVDQSIARPGVVGSTIINEKTVELLDVVHYLAPHAPRAASRQHAGEATPCILLVEPSQFFRDVLAPAIRSLNYTIAAAEDAAAALKLLADGYRPDVLLVAEDLPDMPARELIAQARSAGKAGNFPAALLSTAPQRQRDSRNDLPALSRFDTEAVLTYLAGIRRSLAEAA